MIYGKGLSAVLSDGYRSQRCCYSLYFLSFSLSLSFCSCLHPVHSFGEIFWLHFRLFALRCCPKTQSLWTQTRWCCELNSSSYWRKHSTTGIPTSIGYVSVKPAALCMTHQPVMDIKLPFSHKHKVVAAKNAHAALPSALDSMQLLFIWVTLCTFPWFPNWLSGDTEILNNGWKDTLNSCFQRVH